MTAMREDAVGATVEPATGGSRSSESTWPGTGLAEALLDAAPIPLLVIDADDTVRFANRVARLDGGRGTVGPRFGDVLGCEVAGQGCGTTPTCAVCGAWKAVRLARGGDATAEECRLRTRGGDSISYRVTATPVDVAGERWLVCGFLDVSVACRHRILEHAVFHDVMNLASGVRGLSELRATTPVEQRGDLDTLIESGASALTNMIQDQRTVVLAERGGLELSLKELDARALLESVRSEFDGHELCRQRRLVIAGDAVSGRFISDKTVLSLVLRHLVRNAMEAAPRGTVVTLGCGPDGRAMVFRVHNPGVMSDVVRLQLFHRGFSTRGEGRGIGTYAVKLLTERFLRGKVDVVSEEPHGTVFSVRVPHAAPSGPRGE